MRTKEIVLIVLAIIVVLWITGCSSEPDERIHTKTYYYHGSQAPSSQQEYTNTVYQGFDSDSQNSIVENQAQITTIK